MSGHFGPTHGPRAPPTAARRRSRPPGPAFDASPDPSQPTAEDLLRQLATMASSSRADGRRGDAPPPGRDDTSRAAGDMLLRLLAGSGHAAHDNDGPGRSPRGPPHWGGSTALVAAPSSPRPVRQASAGTRERYAQERSILRELVAGAMRGADGTYLRHVPDENGQERMWTEYRRGGDDEAPQLVPEGVSLAPETAAVPELLHEEDLMDEADGGTGREDLHLRSVLTRPLLGSGARDAISLCGECGHLHGRVVSYVSSVLDDDGSGMRCGTSRAFAARLERELGIYHERLSELEDMLPPLEMPEDDGDGDGGAYLTLRSLSARVPPVRDHLRTLAMLSDGVGMRNLRGGRLLSSILRHSLDGRTAHSELVRSVAADASKPWYAILRRWMRRGMLEDVHSEFFVREVPPEEIELDDDRREGGDMTSGYFTWHRRYVLVEGRVPLCSSGGLMDVMTIDLAREVLLVGKGINFIRYCLGDREWEVDGDGGDGRENEGCGNDSNPYDFASLSDLDAGSDELRCISTLHAATSASSARIHRRILDSLESEHHLTDHLRALKQFLFLGQGDFVSSLVVGLDAEFRGRTSVAGIYDHVLAGVLEGAVRNTNARFMPHHVLSNLRARLAAGGNGDADRYWMGPPPGRASLDDDDGDGRPLVPWDEESDRSAQDPWDHVALEYSIPSPVDAIVHSGSMAAYTRIFRFLFRLRRVEWMLNDSWRKSTALNHAILRETKAGGADAPLVATAAEHASFLLRRISTTRQTMLHFISNLQSYLMFEVLERGWEALAGSLGRARTLDDVIRAHDVYLDEIVEKALLGPEGGDPGASGGSDSCRSLEYLLRRLLTTALRFGKFQEHIFANSIRGLDRAARVRRRVEERADRGDWGRTTLDEEEGQVFRYLADASLFDFVERTTRSFDGALGELLRTMGRAVDEVELDVAEDNGDDEHDGAAGPSAAGGRTHDALPFLLFRLDFSGYYQRMARENKRRKKKAAATATAS